ncbi:PTS fructose transporter subunit IIA [Spiribacter sp. C176]|uniref:PTS fructose transporter subunit IIA n=1 Tax=Spiribacter salilacus TaxID=2664894 RepID=A0A6N7QTB2_9GAMM|nr:PTS fructose transporter subunit IIA [Spiribacter salilacus]MRH78633.1 PTS fructose transporter subunit IIA [Spiribacter salilacus]
MNVAILLITHQGLGAAMRQTVEEIMGDPPLSMACIEPGLNESVGRARQRALETADQLSAEYDGVLILTDAYGATPCNIAVAVGEQQQAPVVTGLNLPMLLRVMSYPSLSPHSLAAKALSIAEDGITLATPQHAPVH